MANTKSSARRAVKNLQRQARNQKIRTATRTAVRIAIRAIQTSQASWETAYRGAISALDRAVSKGVFPKKRASRKMSRLAAFIKRVQEQAAGKTASS